MVAIAGGILLAVLLLAALPIAIAMIARTFQMGAQAVGIALLCCAGFVPFVAMGAIVEHYFPGYGAVAAAATLIFALLLSVALDMLGFPDRWRERWSSHR